jgi:ferritin-like protein
MSNLHEPREELSDACRDLHRAISSLREELEAVDWYHQRVETCRDPELKKVLAHNRDEEIEHACMVLEWLRRKVPTWDENLEKYLFRSGAIVDVEHTGPEGVARGLGLARLEREDS